ncbi:HlyD family secretion protein [Glaciimonas sp. PAMC28666]|uniref:HlyD family secretion protein n=1 Tax=Glaciimonas sp. PAMC28666 TaxID=2807626 RepID=UPI0019667B3A|nr:HlyD family efflux transporter periplasmic adaptor subunit [Glaciimonas sp. PAMC28666]QRX84129.1 HlyD family efflux transporter periplasmic adaptor subunit [Glaciimonas sp. PAMC28666]
MIAILLISSILLSHAEIHPSRGIYMSASRMVEIRAPVAGALMAVFVKEGQPVKRGTPLFSVAQTIGNENGPLVNSRQSALRSQIEEADKNLALTKQDIVLSKAASVENRRALEAEKIQLQSAGKLTDDMIRIEQEKLNRSKQLHTSGLITFSDWQEMNKQFMSRQLERIRLTQQQDQNRKQLQQVSTDLARELGRIEKSSNDIASQKFTLIQNISTMTEDVVTAYAPSDGVIVDVLQVLGNNVQAGQKSVVTMEVANQKDATPRVIAYIGSQDIGTIDTNLNARLWFDAYPADTYGTFPARIERISKMPISNPDNMPVKLKAGQTYYQATLRLEQPYDRHGKLLVLSDGLSLTVDLVGERKTVLEWVIAPINRIRERVFSRTSS